jgi:hypothetical protein
MAADDRTINIRVDQMLVRRGIDTSKLSASTTKGSVVITGYLKGRSKSSNLKSGADVKQLDFHIRRIPNVKSVNWQLSNWRHEGGRWKQIQGVHEEEGGGGAA